MWAIGLLRKPAYSDVPNKRTGTLIFETFFQADTLIRESRVGTRETRANSINWSESGCRLVFGTSSWWLI